MKTISLTQGKAALVDDEDYPYLSRWTWHAMRSTRTFYAARSRRKADGPGPHVILMHRVILQSPDGLETDHMNGDGLDNRRENLQAVTRAINQANRIHQRSRKRNLPMGVYPHGRGFEAKIGIQGRLWYLGTFDSPEEALAVYRAAREERITGWQSHRAPGRGSERTREHRRPDNGKPQRRTRPEGPAGAHQGPASGPGQRADPR